MSLSVTMLTRYQTSKARQASKQRPNENAPPRCSACAEVIHNLSDLPRDEQICGVVDQYQDDADDCECEMSVPINNSSLRCRTRLTG